jgi:PAS domain S-box-containing protein
MDEVYKILVVEDVTHDAELIEHEIVKVLKSCIFKRTWTEKDFIRLLADFQPKMIISDYYMPGFDGLTALKIAREKMPEIPFIIVTGTLNEDIAVECMRSGASDYVIKEYIKRLGPSILNALEQYAVKIEKNNTQAALLESAERHRSLFEDNIAVMLLLDEHTGEILDANQAASNFYGYTRDELKKMQITHLDTLPADKALEELEKARVQKKKRFQFQHKLKDGNIRDVEIYSSRIKAFGKDIMHSIVHDITDKIKMEQELIASKEKAEENDRLKTAFLHNISHEIRTPLNAIVGFSSFLNQANLTMEKRKEFTDIISLSSEQLLSIITDIIIVATLEAGQERIHKKEIDINQTIAAVYEQFCIKSLYPNITIQYHSDIPDHAAQIVTDGVKLIQILTNLVGNALKYTREGRVEFSCAIKTKELYFRIEDTGIGIPKHLHQKIFDRFWQVDSTVTREFGGTGLGLSISKAYVELMGGRIWLDSEPGIGSVFHFTVPYEPVKKSRQSGSEETDKTFLESSSKKVILIAEDEINNFLLVREYLSKSVFTVIRVENGLDAVNIIKNRKDIDIILMDIKMPVMDGIEATRQIKIMKPEIPVIAVTAYAYDTDKIRLLESGFDEYLPKPLKRDSLLKMINQFV